MHYNYYKLKGIIRCQYNSPQILSWSADSTMGYAPLMVMVEVFTQADLSLKIQRVIQHIKI